MKQINVYVDYFIVKLVVIKSTRDKCKEQMLKTMERQKRFPVLTSK